MQLAIGGSGIGVVYIDLHNVVSFGIFRSSLSVSLDLQIADGRIRNKCFDSKQNIAAGISVVKQVSTRYNLPHRDLEKCVNAIDLQDRLERLCSLLRSESRAFGAALGLQPVQLEVLHYLALCNRYSDTPQAVADYLGSTKGTVSQTLNVLERKGLVSKKQDARDKRVQHLSVTATGRGVLKKILPAPYLRHGCALLSEERVNALGEGLTELLRMLQQSNGLKSFGQCRSCRFNRERDDGFFCALTQEPLSKQDAELICREHEFPDNRETH